MKFYNEEDLENGNFERFCQEIEELQQKALRNSHMLTEFPKPKFNTIEEALQYYNAIPLSEWEKKIKEKYGM